MPFVHVYKFSRICSEYESFRSRALKVPEDSSEMMELIAYMEEVKGGKMADLQQDVKDSLKRLTYLLDVHTFRTEEMQLNQSTLLWPQNVSPIFEENELVNKIIYFLSTIYIMCVCV